MRRDDHLRMTPERMSSGQRLLSRRVPSRRPATALREILREAARSQPAAARNSPPCVAGNAAPHRARIPPSAPAAPRPPAAPLAHRPATRDRSIPNRRRHRAPGSPSDSADAQTTQTVAAIPGRNGLPLLVQYPATSETPCAATRGRRQGAKARPVRNHCRRESLRDMFDARHIACALRARPASIGKSINRRRRAEKPGYKNRFDIAYQLESFFAPSLFPSAHPSRGY